MSRGFSLIELVVTSALLLFLTGGITLVTMNGMRYFRLGYAYQTAQQQALVAMRKLVDELQNSRRDSVSSSSSPSPEPHLVFLSARPPEPTTGALVHDVDGRLLWQKWVCYYLTTDRQLVRTERPLDETPPGLIVPPLPAAPLVAEMAALQGRRIADGIEAVTFNPGPLRYLDLSLTGRAETGSDRSTRVILRSRVWLLNSP